MRWEAFPAANLPPILEDEIMKNQLAFRRAADQMSPEELFRSLPMSFPTTHLWNPDICPAVARYPLDEWEKEGHLCIDEDGWIAFCMQIAARDHENLACLWSQCKVMQDKSAAKRAAKM